MADTDMKNLLVEARGEIIDLRRRNEILAAKVSMIELFELVLHTKPAIPEYGETEDLVWKLGQKIRDLDDA